MKELLLMEQEKRDLLANLYALRAGLSVISKYTDKISNSVNDINKKNKQSDEITNKIKIYNSTSQKYLKEREDYQSFLKDFSQFQEELYSKKRKKEVRLRRKIFFKGFAFTITIAILIFFTILSIVSFFLPDSGTGILIFFAPIVYFLAFKYLQHIDFIGEIQYIKHGFHVSFEEQKIPWLEQKKSLEKSLLQNHNTLAELQKEISKDINKPTLTKENLSTFKTKDAEIISYNENLIKIYATQAKHTYLSLIQLFNTFLSEADWGNIDLLIFYLETGRADNLKEALQLVDRQRQTDQITVAISYATRQICSSIHTSMQRLGNSLSKSFSIISNQLASLQQELEKSNNLTTQVLAESLNQSQKLNELSSAQLSATEFNSALLEKANKTSEELLNDLRYGQKYWIK